LEAIQRAKGSFSSTATECSVFSWKTWSSGRGSGSFSFGPDREVFGGLPVKPCEVEPPSCYYDEIGRRLLIDLPSDNGRFLTEDSCSLLFTGQMSGRSETCVGKRRNHNYGIRATTPAWHCPEKLKIIIFTMAGQVLGWGYFEFLPREQNGPPSISFQLPLGENWRETAFIKAITSPNFSHSSPAEPPLPYPVQESAYCFHMYLSSSTAPVIELLDRIIGFSLHHGIPESLSLMRMFSNLPDLKAILESSRYAAGSLSDLLNYIQSESRHEEVKRQFHDLITMVRR
jgi:hypothetical protein